MGMALNNNPADVLFNLVSHPHPSTLRDEMDEFQQGALFDMVIPGVKVALPGVAT